MSVRGTFCWLLGLWWASKATWYHYPTSQLDTVERKCGYCDKVERTMRKTEL